MSFQFENKNFYITGVANKKSIAFHVAQTIISHGGNVIFSVQNEQNLKTITKYFPGAPSFILDVENLSDVARISDQIGQHFNKIHGFLHSLAFAHFDPKRERFYQTSRQDFLQACQISAFSLVEITHALLPKLDPDASIVTISISNTKATSYGYLGPIKAMLETIVCYLAKSLSYESKIRVNSIGAGPLKTSASAGIPNYIENYLYSEALSLRKHSLKTQEVANTACFLLSSLSSGVNAENFVVDSGINSNYFDQDIVKTFSKNL